MLDHQILSILLSSRGVLQSFLDKRLGDHQLCVCHSSRSNFEAPALELVLGIDFTKVLPARRLAITSRNGLFHISRYHILNETMTYWMMRYLFRDVSVSVGYSVFKRLAQKRVERLGDSPNSGTVIAHCKRANKGNSLQAIRFLRSDSQAGVVLHIFGCVIVSSHAIKRNRGNLTHPLKHRSTLVEADREGDLGQVFAN